MSYSRSEQNGILAYDEDRLAGGKICGYGGCRNPEIAITLQALPFYRIKLDQIDFCSCGATLICQTVQDANSAAVVLRQFPKIVQYARSGSYANSDRGWVEVHFGTGVSPWN